MTLKKLAGFHTSTIGDKQYKFKFGTAAMIEFETAYDMPLLELVEKIEDPKTRRVEMIVKAFHAALTQYHPDVDFNQACELVDALGLMPAAQVVLQTMDAAFPAVKTGGDVGKKSGNRNARRTAKAKPKK